MKILILRFSAIGDIVLTSPVIRCLAEQQQADIHYATKSAFAAIPAQHPSIIKVFALGEPAINRSEKVHYHPSMSGLLTLLKKEKYDYIVDLHHNLRTLQIKTALGIRSSSFNKLNLKKWLLVNTGINRLPDRHIVHRYMETVGSLGVQYDGKGLDFFMPDHTAPEVNIFLAQEHPFLSTTPFIAFVIGATHFTKRLPEDKIIALCRKIQQPIVLLGGKAEAETGAKVAAAAGEQVVNLCGALSLFGSAEMVRRSAMVITHDTGLMHIAAAFQKKIIAIWGNTVPAFGMYPFYPEGKDAYTNAEVMGLACRPCSKIGYAQCPKGHFNCMNNIDLAQILEQI